MKALMIGVGLAAIVTPALADFYIIQEPTTKRDLCKTYCVGFLQELLKKLLLLRKITDILTWPNSLAELL